MEYEFYKFASYFDLPHDLIDFNIINVNQQFFLKNVKRVISLAIKGKNYGFYEIKKIGSGSYGDIFLYSYGNVFYENSLFALKFMEFKSKDELTRTNVMKSILNDSLILTELDHENVVKGYFFFKFKSNYIDYFCNLMEYCNAGTLENYIEKKKKKNKYLSEEKILKIFLEILKGIQYANNFFMSKKNELFLHRDLKPDNILFHKKDQVKIIKIADFGLAKSIGIICQSQSNPSRESTANYQSPEMANGVFSNNCDIWSLGVILYQMCFYEFPWGNLTTPKQIFDRQIFLFQENVLQFNNQERKITQEMQNLLRSMIKFDSNKRISFKELFSNEFFKKELEKDKAKYKHFANSENYKELSLQEKNNIIAIELPEYFKSEFLNKKLDKKFCEYLKIVRKIRNNNIIKFDEIEELKDNYSNKISEITRVELMTEDFENKNENRY